MKNLERYFSNDEIKDKLVELGSSEGLSLKKLPGIKYDRLKDDDKNKEEITEEYWEISKEGKRQYFMQYSGEDFHYEGERGKDSWKTSIKDKNGTILFTSEHHHINNPACYGDCDEYNGPPVDKTILYEENDELINNLFYQMEEYHQERILARKMSA